MKYCSKCGNELLDEAVICPKCGCAIEGEVLAKKEKKMNGLKIAALVLIILSLISIFCYIFVYVPIAIAVLTEGNGDPGVLLTGIVVAIAAIYLILGAVFGIMTVVKLAKKRKISTGIKVCVLLFTNLISGILLLVDKE